MIIEGRIRAPLVPLLTPFVSYAIVAAVKHRGEWRRWVPHWLLSGAFVATLVWCAHHLPAKFYPSDLPETATSVDIPLGNGLRLVAYEESSGCHVHGGYLYLDFYWRYEPGAAQESEALAWFAVTPEATKKPFRPRVFTVGHRTYPPVGAAEWPEGALFKESYFLSIPGRSGESVQVQVASVGPDGKTPEDPQVVVEIPVQPPDEPLSEIMKRRHK